jgi:site-specific DNA-methyltransferase (adenine-specific)
MAHIVKLPAVLPISDGSSFIAHATFDELLSSLPPESVDVVYADPPFNTGLSRTNPRDATSWYADDMPQEEWVESIQALAQACRRVLKPHGSMYLHLDWHGVHEAKLLAMDVEFGHANQLGEIIWAYDWGARQKDCFAQKHDTILHYAKNKRTHRFDVSRVDRVPYKAPELQMYRSKRLGKDDGAARIAAGKPVTDVFQDINIVGTSSNERKLYSYPTMKPAKLVKRLLSPVVVPGSVILDPFCGSGASLQAASELLCSFVVGDANVEAVRTASLRAKMLEAKFVTVER